MKRVILLILIVLSCFGLTGCCYVLGYDSLEEYKSTINSGGLGNSVYEIDHPNYFLPSLTFLDDYEYLQGNYFFYEKDVLCLCEEHKNTPDRALITLKYDENVFLDAMECLNNSIPPYENIIFTYNDYVFYFNKKFMDRFVDVSCLQIPNWFTMVCYNQKKYTICFIGFHHPLRNIDKKYVDDLENNWGSFIEQYYGEWYSFSYN